MKAFVYGSLVGRSLPFRFHVAVAVAVPTIYLVVRCVFLAPETAMERDPAKTGYEVSHIIYMRHIAAMAATTGMSYRLRLAEM